MTSHCVKGHVRDHPETNGCFVFCLFSTLSSRIIWKKMRQSWDGETSWEVGSLCLKDPPPWAMNTVMWMLPWLLHFTQTGESRLLILLTLNWNSTSNSTVLCWLHLCFSCRWTASTCWPVLEVQQLQSCVELAAWTRNTSRSVLQCQHYDREVGGWGVEVFVYFLSEVFTLTGS